MYDRRVSDRELTFGISGKLYKQNVLLYDQQTDSLWSQIKRQAVTGELTGNALKVLPSVETSWQEWKLKYPNTLVLSDRTGYDRDYRGDPYSGLRFEDKVIGIEIAGETEAYPFAELKKASGQVRDLVGGQGVTIRYDVKSDMAVVLDSKGDPLPAMTVAREIWLRFYPRSTLFRARRAR